MSRLAGTRPDSQTRPDHRAHPIRDGRMQTNRPDWHLTMLTDQPFACAVC